MDVWAAGALLYFVKFGHRPFLLTKNFRFEVAQNGLGLYLPTDLFCNKCEDRHTEMIERCLIVDPEQRASALQLREMNHTVLKQEETKRIKVVILGEFGVGKTGLLNKMARNQLQQQVSVVHRMFQFNKEQVQLDFHDTLGTEQRSNSIIKSIYRAAHLVFLVFSLQRKETYQALEEWRYVAQTHSNGC